MSTDDTRDDPWCTCGRRQSAHPTDNGHRFERSHAFNGGAIRPVKSQAPSGAVIELWEKIDP